MSATPGADPALYESDPVFVEHFNSWVRGVVDPATAAITPRVRQLVRLASVVGANGVPRFEVLAGGALDAVITPVELKELVYQSVPIVGYATASDFLRVTNDLLRLRGIDLPLPDQSAPAAGDVPDSSGPLDRYAAGYLHGDLMARGGLTTKDRVLVSVALLVALGSAPPLLQHAVRAAAAAGHDREVLLAVLVALIPAVGLPRVQQALPALDAVLP